MSEPNVWLVEGEPVLVMAVVTDTHWRDKKLYKVRLITQDGPIEFYIHDRQLQEVPEA